MKISGWILSLLMIWVEAASAYESYVVNSAEPTGKYLLRLQLDSRVQLFDILSPGYGRRTADQVLIKMLAGKKLDIKEINKRRYAVTLQFRQEPCAPGANCSPEALRNVYRYGLLYLVVEEGRGSTSALVIKSMPANFTFTELTPGSTITLHYQTPTSAYFVDPELLADQRAHYHCLIPDGITLKLSYATSESMGA
jgi:hypothetical protein